MHPDERALTLVLIGWLLLFHGAQAQSYCRTEEDRTDPFTKVRVLTVASDSFSKGPAYRWRAESSILTLEMIWDLPSEERVAVLEGDPLFLLLENDSLLILYCPHSEVSAPQVGASRDNQARGSFAYSVSNREAALLNKHGVRRIRLRHSEGFLEFTSEEDPGWQLGLQQLTSCFLTMYATAPIPVNTMVTLQTERPAAGKVGNAP